LGEPPLLEHTRQTSPKRPDIFIYVKCNNPVSIYARNVYKPPKCFKDFELDEIILPVEHKSRQKYEKHGCIIQTIRKRKDRMVRIQNCL
jgi:hypothetical protein